MYNFLLAWELPNGLEQPLEGACEVQEGPRAAQAALESS